MVSLLPLRFQFVVSRPEGPGFAIADNVPPRQGPVMPKIDKALMMIDVGHITGNCPPLPYRRAITERAGQVACVWIDVRPSHTGHALSRHEWYSQTSL